MSEAAVEQVLPVVPDASGLGCAVPLSFGRLPRTASVPPMLRAGAYPLAPHAADEDWTARAACGLGDPDELFVQGAEQNRVKARCMGCPVRLECLADALDNRIEFGVWGGLTERERRALLRRRPLVRSWRRLLEDARRHHTAEALPAAV
jgi:WhiB family transcriptional regulator, redox-sensing transcriptional regulator